MKRKNRVTGIGGIFFKSNQPKELNKWYAKNLGMVMNEYGSLIEFRKPEKPDNSGFLQWSTFEKDTEYFQPSSKDYMINYRVNHLNELVDELRENGVTILDDIEVYEYGKFVHILDPENNKIELWEPVDEVFTEMYKDDTTK